MTQILTGIRVLEVASWTFVPAAGAVMADWGADVIKIEHPLRGDPQRGLVRAGVDASRPNGLMQQSNRGKRSIAVDIATPEGLELLYRLAESADVFLTNWLPSVRQRRRIDVEHLRERNPRIIYARGHGQGTRGAEADRPAFDGTAYLARGGFAAALTPADADWPINGSAAIGDLPGAMVIAGGICGALLHRERTGEALTVDVSLLGLAMWTIAPDIVTAGIAGQPVAAKPQRERNPNPISVQYRTSDGRFVKFSMLESDRYFADLCECLGVPELAADPRYVDSAARADHRQECVAELDRVFASLTVAEVRARLSSAKGAWAIVAQPFELLDDPQALANDYFAHTVVGGTEDVRIVTPPAQFNEETVTELAPSPEHGQHTEEVLLELGYSWDQIGSLQANQVL